MTGVVIAAAVLIALATIGIILGYRIWQIQSLAFASNQFDGAERKGARTELRRIVLSKLDILTYLKDDPVKTQAILQMVYAFNRIGAGMRKGALNRGIIFETWKKYWFVDNWNIFEPLIAAERKRRNDPKLYEAFEWLCNKCK